MDIAVLAAAAATALFPYLAKAAEGFAEGLGNGLPDHIGRLWNTIVTKLKSKKDGDTAIANLAAQPTKRVNQEAFREELEKALDEDTEFRAEVFSIVRASNIVSTQSGDVFLGVGAFKVGTNFGTINYGSTPSTSNPNQADRTSD